MSFSTNLFWDADPAQLDLQANRQYVVGRVLDRGTLDDFRQIVSYYGRDELIAIAMGLRTLEPKALSFISCVSGVPKEKFRCYTSKQSSPAHWIY